MWPHSVNSLMTRGKKIFIISTVIMFTATACDVVTLKAVRDELRVIKTLHTVTNKTDSTTKED